MIKASDYQHFVGKKVNVEVKTLEFKSNRGKITKYDRYDLTEGDETMRDIRVLVESQDGILRVWFPNSIGTMEMRDERVNVQVDKGEDGSYSVTKVYVG